MISNYFKLTPSMDCFTQELYPNEIYWACPPPRLIIDLFKHIVHFVILL